MISNPEKDMVLAALMALNAQATLMQVEIIRLLKIVSPEMPVVGALPGEVDTMFKAYNVGTPTETREASCTGACTCPACTCEELVEESEPKMSEYKVKIDVEKVEAKVNIDVEKAETPAEAEVVKDEAYYAERYPINGKAEWKINSESSSINGQTVVIRRYRVRPHGYNFMVSLADDPAGKVWEVRESVMKKLARGKKVIDVKPVAKTKPEPKIEVRDIKAEAPKAKAEVEAPVVLPLEESHPLDSQWELIDPAGTYDGLLCTVTGYFDNEGVRHLRCTTPRGALGCLPAELRPIRQA